MGTSVDAWDTTLATWIPRANLHTPRMGAGAVTAGDSRIYAVGGEIAVGGPVTASVEAYLPDRDRWIDVAAAHDARMIACVALGADGRIYAAGGDSATPIMPATEVYGPVITLSPATASPGATVSIAGSNFAASAGVGITLDGAPVAIGTTDASGNVTLSFVVPAIASGPHAVVGVDGKSQFPTAAQLQVP